MQPRLAENPLHIAQAGLQPEFFLLQLPCARITGVWQHTQGLHRFKADMVPASREMGNRPRVSPLTKKPFAIDAHWQREKKSLGIPTTLQGRSYALV